MQHDVDKGESRADGNGSQSDHQHHAGLGALDLLKSDRLVYASTIARALTSPRDRWTTRRARRWLRRSKIGFQLGPRGGWATTWAKFFAHYQAMATEALRGLGGAGECPWCGREEQLEDE